MKVENGIEMTWTPSHALTESMQNMCRIKIGINFAAGNPGLLSLCSNARLYHKTLILIHILVPRVRHNKLTVRSQLSWRLLLFSFGVPRAFDTASRNVNAEISQWRQMLKILLMATPTETIHQKYSTLSLLLACPVIQYNSLLPWW